MPRPTTRLALHSKDASLLRLTGSERHRDLAALHLNTRSVRILERSGIKTIGRLIESLDAGFGLKTAPTSKSYAEITSAIQKLSEAISPDCTVDWTRYATSRGFEILPFGTSPSAFLPDLPETIRHVVKVWFSSFYLEVFDRYIMTPAETSSQDVSVQLQCHKQSVGLANVTILRSLREAIFHDRYLGAPFRFRKDFVNVFRCLGERLDLKPEVFRHAELTAATTDLPFTVPWNERSERLLLAILGYTSLYPFGEGNVRVVVRSRTYLPAIGRAFSRVQSLLRRRFPTGLTKEQLLEELRRAGETQRTIESVSMLFEGIPNIEELPGGSNIVVAKLGRLTRVADQLERILRRNARPTSLSEMEEELSAFEGRLGSLRTSIHLCQAMSGDPRFKPIGRSGRWTLAEWELERGTIVNVAAEILSRSEGPMSGKELRSLIAKRRPLARESLASLLRRDDRFVRVNLGSWTLKK